MTSTQSSRPVASVTRTIAAVVLGLVAGIATIAAPIGWWVHSELSDTDWVVAQVQPLAQDTSIQQALSRDVAAELPPTIVALAGDGVNQIIGKVMDSDTFGRAWGAAVRQVQSQAIATLRGESDALTVSPDASGSTATLAIQLGPLVDAVKTDIGPPIAGLIPEVDSQIVIASSSDVLAVQRAYQVADGVGTWAPWIALIAWLATLVIAVNRWRALGWLGVSVALAGLVGYATVVVGRQAAITGLESNTLPGAMIGTVFDSLSGTLTTLAIVGGIAGVVLAVVGFVAGAHAASRTARR